MSSIIDCTNLQISVMLLGNSTEYGDRVTSQLSGSGEASNFLCPCKVQ